MQRHVSLPITTRRNRKQTKHTQHAFLVRFVLCLLWRGSHSSLTRRITQISSSAMHFFKMLDTSSHKDKLLELPNDFTDMYGPELFDLAIIKVLNSIWHIRLKKTEGVILFENGWPEFMEFYSICVGHVLLFRYGGNSEFQVHIFGTDATEIDYPSYIDNTDHEVEMTSANLDEDEVEVPSIHSGSTQSNYEPSISSESAYDKKAKPARQKKSRKTRKQKPVVPIRLYTKAFQATLEAAEAFTSENPYFKVIMQTSYIKGLVRVPIVFANSYLRNRTDLEITLRISDGRTWEVRYVSRAPTGKKQFRGWGKFVAGNHLKEGDVCVFELVDRKKFEMNVHIFRQQKTFSSNLNSGSTQRNYEPSLSSESSYDQKVDSARRESPQKIQKQKKLIPKRIHTKAFQETLEAAEAFKSENPSFKSILQASHLKGILKVPIAFASSYLKNITRMVISLRISDGRTWKVGCVSGTQAGRLVSKLSKGWYKFVADNHLKEGDVCVFELVDREKIEMNVHIFQQQKTFTRKLNPKLIYYTVEFQETLEAAKEFASENPFFKIVMQASYVEGHEMRVPAVFANSHLRNITETVITLMVSDGRTWKVRYVSRQPANKRLSHGWHNFVADNDLNEGDVCVFEVVDRKNIEMIVHIFRQQKPSARKLTPKSSNYTVEFQATLEASEKFTSENPYFKVVMQSAHIKRGTLNVPAVFATPHLTNLTRMVITLRVSDEKTWAVGYVSRTPTERRISQGWGDFVADNDLKEGDVCVFELVDSQKNFEMIVHIFRLVQENRV